MELDCELQFMRLCRMYNSCAVETFDRKRCKFSPKLQWRRDVKGIMKSPGLCELESLKNTPRLRHGPCEPSLCSGPALREARWWTSSAATTLLRNLKKIGPSWSKKIHHVGIVFDSPCSAAAGKKVHKPYTFPEYMKLPSVWMTWERESVDSGLNARMMMMPGS